MGEIWEFEGDWYLSINEGFSICMNSEATAKKYVQLQELVEAAEKVDRAMETMFKDIHIFASNEDDPIEYVSFTIKDVTNLQEAKDKLKDALGKVGG